MTPQPTFIRGTHYPSQRAAARAIGVSPKTVFQSLERGTQERVGLAKPTGQLGRPGRACHINGRDWPSITAAARALGVRRNTIFKALEAGRDVIRPGKGAA